MAVMMEPESGSYPVRLDVEYPEHLSRWLIFVKWILAIPHLIILYFLRLLFNIITLVTVFAILFTRKYPRDLFTYAVGVRRWESNVRAYMSFMRDEYPPFSWDPGRYPVRFEVDYPEQLNRWLPLVKWLLAVPHYVVLLLLGVAWVLVLFIVFFAILFTGRYPRGLFDFGVGVHRWQERVTMYVCLATDEYPPFRLRA
jgi:hypothetical protein